MQKDEKSLREALAQSLVDGWHCNSTMSFMIRHTYINAGVTPPETVQDYFGKIADIVKVKRIHGEDRVQTWIPRHFRHLNDALWDGRNRDFCVRVARKALGLNDKKGSFLVKVRELEKRHDWNTVK
jgi:hypothetical protein